MTEDHVRQLLLLMHADKKGMVSREGYMKYMEAKFDHLDKERKGELDAKQRNQVSTPPVSSGNKAGECAAATFKLALTKGRVAP